MTIYEALAQMIAVAGYGVEGQSLFVYQIPANCSIGIVVRAPVEGVPYNGYIPGYLVGSYQVIVRDVDFEDGSRRADQIMSLLTFSNRDFDLVEKQVHVNHSIPRTHPIVYPRMDNNQMEWSITFDLNAVEA
jgi:hypothetical protein